jgi:hypothetical protein
MAAFDGGEKWGRVALALQPSSCPLWGEQDGGPFFFGFAGVKLI